MHRPFIHHKPKLAHLAGRALFFLGGLLIVLGIIGRIAKTAVNSVRERGKLAPLEALSDLYPTLPVWAVPEGAIGFTFAALIAAAGIYLALQARSVLKQTTEFGRRRRG